MKYLVRLAAVLTVVAAIVMAVFWNRGGMIRSLRLSDGNIIGIKEMIGEIRGARLIFVGENHEQMKHHRAQLEIIEMLYRSGMPLAIGLEQFTADRQHELDQWVAGTLELNSFITLYYHEWNMPWPLYRDIFIFARTHRIPLIGLNLPREISHKVASEGFAALTPDERKRIPAGITCTVDPEYMEFIRKAYAMHSRKDKLFVNFCEAQMLWNKGMGYHLQQYLARNPGRAVVVLLGTGHAMKSGIPEEVFKETGYGYKVILPEMPDLDRQTASVEDADYLLLFDHAGGR